MAFLSHVVKKYIQNKYFEILNGKKLYKKSKTLKTNFRFKKHLQYYICTMAEDAFGI